MYMYIYLYLPICRSTYLPIYPPTTLASYVSISLSTDLSICLSAYMNDLSSCLSAHLHTHILTNLHSIDQCIYARIYVSAYLPICSCTYLFVYLPFYVGAFHSSTYIPIHVFTDLPISPYIIYLYAYCSQSLIAAFVQVMLQFIGRSFDVAFCTCVVQVGVCNTFALCLQLLC